MPNELSRLFVRGAAASIALALLTFTPKSEAFCRTTTESMPADYRPSIDGCWKSGAPLWWQNACVGYSLQRDASRHVSFDAASAAVASAFNKWSSCACPSDDATTDSRTSRVSIDARDEGPVDCSLAQYNSNGPNQHVIVFRDDAWPYDGSTNILALTTVIFNPFTGEILDADMEINTFDQTLSLENPLPPSAYDLTSIITHEAGHFLGLAHSLDPRATMFATSTPGTTTIRDLAPDDVAGICAAYPPGGRRAVGEEVADGGIVLESACDPTPKHGFSGSCASTKKGCSVSPVAGPGAGAGPSASERGAAGAIFLSALTLALSRRMRRA